MIFIIPIIFGAIGAAVGAVAGAFVAQAAGEGDRQEAKHHRAIANELTTKYKALEKRYYELTDASQKHISELTCQGALDEVEKDALRLALRLQHHLLSLVQDIDRQPSAIALQKFREAVAETNQVLASLAEELIFIPSQYYVRNYSRAIKGDRQESSPIKNSEYSRRISHPTHRSNEFKGKAVTMDKLVIASAQFQDLYDRINRAGAQLLQYLRELREGRLSEGDKTEGLQSVEEAILNALNALQKQQYQVAVIAAMKAGKSTFLNALIGADILASESEACTVCRTDIRLLEAGKTPRLLEYREGKREPVLLIEGNAEEIRHSFLERTHQIRQSHNQDATTRFELWHPIDAISSLSSLAGFTLVDTPGPNEWESISFNTNKLKETALEALRTCDAILFILDYSSFKDNTNLELLQNLIQNRKDFLQKNTGKIYFILNKVDWKSESDRPIEKVIDDLKKALIGFGIPNPIVYPASARQGLLAKLIQQEVATEAHLKDFKKFFSAKYATENEEGDSITPAPRKIAPQALKDSLIPSIEQSVIKTVVEQSGWNLLSDVLAKLDKSARQIEQSLMAAIRGWEMEFADLQKNVEEYANRSDSAMRKVETVKKSIQAQNQQLIDEFSQEVSKFAERSKNRIKVEINKVAISRSLKSKKNLSTVKKTKSLANLLWDKFASIFEESPTANPYKVRVNTLEDAQTIGKIINEHCTPIIYEFWLETQDQLIRKGTDIRENLLSQIKQDIQAISDELSQTIGKILEVEISNNPIQFPKFEFFGIDAQVHRQQEVSWRKEKRTQKECWKDVDYEDDVPYEQTIYEVDLQQTLNKMHGKIDEQIERTLALLKRVVEQQVKGDFKQAEQQIADYIKLFQSEFDNLLDRRSVSEIESTEIVANLEQQKAALNEYLSELLDIGKFLEAWQPVQR